MSRCVPLSTLSVLSCLSEAPLNGEHWEGDLGDRLVGPRCSCKAYPAAAQVDGTVSFPDPEGMCHSVQVPAESLVRSRRAKAPAPRAGLEAVV